MPARPTVSSVAAILKASERRVVCNEVPRREVKPAASSSDGLRYLVERGLRRPGSAGGDGAAAFERGVL